MGIENFVKTKDYLVCIDSDGCAVDSMTIKHEKAFSTALIDTFNLKEYEAEIRNKWYEINLYSKTRGINRFIGLNLILHYINDNFVTIDDLADFDSYIKDSKAYSNKSLEEFIFKTQSVLLKKCLEWSKLTNEYIKKINENDIKLFDNVKELISHISEYANIVVVSSANLDAIEAEWKRLNIIDYTNLVCSQNDGTKEYCIAKLKEKGFESKKILMIGDSPLDLSSALNNDVYFYPILCTKENNSWANLKKYFEAFINNNFDKYQENLIKKFNDNLE